MVPVSVQNFVDLTTVAHSKPEPPSNLSKPEPTDLWTTIDEYLLLNRDKVTLMSNDWLTDRHIGAAQYLLKRQHPNISGLQNTTLQYTRTFDVHGSRQFVQCLHVFDSHWITVSTMKCPANVVRVYDSFNSRLSTSTKKIICDLLHTKSNYITIEYVNVQFQRGGSDCGLFAIANATAICNGTDPAYLHFKQDEMRKHLKTALEKKSLPPFPSKKVKTLMKMDKEKLHIFCDCRMIDDGRCMVECNGCKNWYHADCISISSSMLGDKQASWYCQLCIKSKYTYQRVAKEVRLLKVKILLLHVLIGIMPISIILL